MTVQSLIALALLATSGLALGSVPFTIPFNVTLSDIHAVFRYNLNNDSTPVWQHTRIGPSCSLSPAPSGTCTSMHLATLDSLEGNKPRVALPDFYGTGLWLVGNVNDYGSSLDGPLAVSVNGSRISPDATAGDTLFGTSSLPLQYHSRGEVSLDEPGNITFLGATFQWTMTAQVLKVSDLIVATQECVSGGQPNSFFRSTGYWRVTDVIEGRNGGGSMAYTHLRSGSSSNEPRPQSSFTVPANTSFMMLNGSMGPDQGQISVQVSPLPPYSNGDLPPPAVQHSRIPQRDAVFYMTTLDPGVEYNVTISAGEFNGSSIAGIHSATFWSGVSADSATPAGNRLSKGAIAGIAVGSVLGVSLLLALAWWLFRRRRAPKHTGNSAEIMMDNNMSSAAALVPPATPDPSDVPAAPPPPASRGDKGASNIIAHLTRARHDSHLGSPSTPSRSPVLPGSTSAFHSSVSPVFPAGPSRPRVEQERDAGAVDDEVELVPPSYDPAWAQRRPREARPAVDPAARMLGLK